MNCFKFEIGALLKKNDIGLANGGRSSLRGGGFSRLKALRVSHARKIMLEKIRLDVDRVLDCERGAG